MGKIEVLRGGGVEPQSEAALLSLLIRSDEFAPGPEHRVPSREESELAELEAMERWGDGVAQDIREAWDDPDDLVAESRGVLDDVLDAVGRSAASLGRVHAEQARAIARAWRQYRMHSADVLASREERARGGVARDDATLLMRCFVSEIAALFRIGDRAASRRVDEALALVRMPFALTALESGEISPAHMSRIVEHVSDLPRDAWWEFDQLAVDAARAQTPTRLSATLRRLRERLHPESLEARAARASSRRAVFLTPEKDGMATLGIHHTADVCLSVMNQIDALALSRRDGEPENGRTLAQLGADIAAEALLTMLAAEAGHEGPFDDHAPAASSDRRDDAASSADHDRGASSATVGTRRAPTPFRPRLAVTIPAMALADDEGRRGAEEGVSLSGVAELAGYGPIAMSTALRIAADAPSLLRIITDPTTGERMAIDPRSYPIPERLRRLIAERDGTCRFPGCGAPAVRCDIDHTVDRQHGGETAEGNLAALCRRHHTLKHVTRWRVRQEDGGILVWTSPAGRDYRTLPCRE